METQSTSASDMPFTQHIRKAVSQQAVSAAVVPWRNPRASHSTRRGPPLAGDPFGVGGCSCIQQTAVVYRPFKSARHTPQNMAASLPYRRISWPHSAHGPNSFAAVPLSKA